MAIEKEINPTVLNEENQVPLGDEGMEVALAAIEEAGMEDFITVSYTHLTLPTKRIV